MVAAASGGCELSTTLDLAATIAVVVFAAVAAFASVFPAGAVDIFSAAAGASAAVFVAFVTRFCPSGFASTTAMPADAMVGVAAAAVVVSVVVALPRASAVTSFAAAAAASASAATIVAVAAAIAVAACSWSSGVTHSGFAPFFGAGAIGVVDNTNVDIQLEDFIRTA